MVLGVKIIQNHPKNLRRMSAIGIKNPKTRQAASLSSAESTASITYPNHGQKNCFTSRLEKLNYRVLKTTYPVTGSIVTMGISAWCNATILPPEK